jgi:hypothetical protein
VFRNLDPFPPSSMRIHSGILLKLVLRRKEANTHSKSKPKPKSLCNWQSVSPSGLAPNTPPPRPIINNILLVSLTTAAVLVHALWHQDGSALFPLSWCLSSIRS